MRMRLVGNRWRAAFRWRGEYRSDSLDAFAHETRKAQVNLGRLIEKLEKGEDPKAQRRRFRDVAEAWLARYEKDADASPHSKERAAGIVRKHLLPAFGSARLGEIDAEAVREYARRRNRPESTLTKELRILRWIMRSVNPAWEPPRKLDHAPARKRTSALTVEEMLTVAEAVPQFSQAFGRDYREIYLLCALTTLDVSDIVHLPEAYIDFERGWIKGVRRKTGKPYRIWMVRQVCAILRARPKRLDPDQPLYTGFTPHNVSKAIHRAFAHCGLAFSAKDLRHFGASFMADAGADLDIIGLALGHARGSRMTGEYVHPSDRAIQKWFGKLDRAVGE